LKRMNSLKYTFESMISYVSGSTSYTLNAGFPPEQKLKLKIETHALFISDLLLGVSAGAIHTAPTAVSAPRFS
jgi:hypothetical protein